MRKPIITTFLVLLTIVSGRSEFTIAAEGRAKCAIVQDSNATEPEKHAARELAKTPQEITGAEVPIETGDSATHESIILLGQGKLAQKISPKIAFDQLTPEEIVLESSAKHLLLAGGRPRGTLYAVSQFLQEQCGVRWWTPRASRVPFAQD